MPEGSDPAVVRPEIVPPLADAVGLVHHQPRHPDAGQGGAERGAREPLRRDVHQPQPPGGQVALRGGALGGCEPRVQRGRGDPPRPEAVDLVLHEGDERRDHDRGAVEQERRQLEAERLPRPGRHDRHEIAPLEDGRRGFLLPGAETVEAEARLEGLMEAIAGALGRMSHGMILRENHSAPWLRQSVQSRRRLI